MYPIIIGSLIKEIDNCDSFLMWYHKKISFPLECKWTVSIITSVIFSDIDNHSHFRDNGMENKNRWKYSFCCQEKYPEGVFINVIIKDNFT